MNTQDPKLVMTQAVQGEPLVVLKTVGAFSFVELAHYPGKPGYMERTHIGSIHSLNWIVPGTMPPVELAFQYLNVPYAWGGMSKEGIDCSGLVHLAYRPRKLIPRDASDIEAYAQEIPPEDLRFGDLITYGKPESNQATHIAFYLGDGIILHADGTNAHQVVAAEEPVWRFEQRRKALRIVLD